MKEAMIHKSEYLLKIYTMDPRGLDKGIINNLCTDVFYWPFSYCGERFFC